MFGIYIIITSPLVVLAAPWFWEGIKEFYKERIKPYLIWK